MGAHFHSHKLLALAVFADSLKAGYVRSVRLHEENVGSLCAVQQEFLLHPGKYKTVPDGPVILGSFCTFLSSVWLTQTLGTIIKMQKNEGWDCMLAYRNDLPLETSMPSVLTPSKNPDLKDVPSLEQDLKAVENAVLSSKASVKASGQSLGVDGKSTPTTPKDSLMWPSPHLTLSCSSGLSFLDHPSSDHIPGLETPPERIPYTQQFDVWQNWGSELELASPKALSLSRAFLPDPVRNEGSSWNPTMMLDLNLDLPKSPSQDDDPDCSLVLSTPVLDRKPLLSFELKTPSLSLQQSSLNDDSTDFSAFETFADSHSSHKNVGKANTRLVKLDVMHNAKSHSSEDSFGCYGSVINMSSSDANANSSTTSSAVYSAHDENAYGSMNTMLNGNSSITSGYMSSSRHYGYVVKGHGKQSIMRGCRSASRQTLRQCGRNVITYNAKPHVVRPGRTSQRITEITLHELTQFFSMPINQAAKELNIGLTVLKKRCREFQILRWPHRKMKSLNSLIGNIQDLAEDQGVKSSVRVMNTVRELEEQKRLMEEMPGVDLGERTKKLRQACFKANYKKRRLGVVNNKNVDVLGVPAAPGPFSSPVSHPLGILDLHPTFCVSPPRSCLTMDHFL